MSTPYEFEFVGDFSEEVYGKYENPSEGLKAVIMGAILKEKEFLVRFPKVNRIAQLVTYEDTTFKVCLDRSS